MNTTQVHSRHEHEPIQDDQPKLKLVDCPRLNKTHEQSSSKAKRSYCRDCNIYWVERIVSDAASSSTRPEPEADVNTDRPIDKTAMMHKQHYATAESFQETTRAPKLPMVDLDTDERVFAILDEGCSSTCHARTSAARAQKHLKTFGQYFMGELQGLY